jgi:hypothetical protein
MIADSGELRRGHEGDRLIIEALAGDREAVVHTGQVLQSLHAT